VLSTLTKVLVVLLTLSSIFLAGIVVTYVSTSDNYKRQYEEEKTNSQAIVEKNAALIRQRNEQTIEQQRLIDNLNEKIQGLQIERNQLQVRLSNIERSRAELEERISGYAAVISGFNQTVSDMAQSLRLARTELDNLREQRVTDRKYLNEITATLDEKIVELESLEAERRRLLEEKITLENWLKELSGRTGQEIERPEPVTPQKDKASAAWPTTDQVSLQAVITEVDLRNSLATISIGSADGVREGQRFHVTRGDMFVCDILITDVEPDQAAGVMELVQYQPRIGDNAVTNW
jgi:chromosome segregation ATPase